jgi:hypothetical protein
VKTGGDDFAPKSIESRLGEQNAIERRIRRQLAKTGRDVSAHFNDAQVLAQQENLDLPARPGGGDTCFDRQSGQPSASLRNENV